MSLTNPTIHIPHERVSVPSWVRHHLTWTLVALAALAAVAVLALTVVDSDSGTRVDPVTSTFDADRGSISAIDHRTAMSGGAVDVQEAPAATPTDVLRRESISAIDRRTPPL